MKKLKQYQYERYAILCQLAYHDQEAPSIEQFPSLNQYDIIDKNGKATARLIWDDGKQEVIVAFRGSKTFKDWVCNLNFLPSKYLIHHDSKRSYIHWGFNRLIYQQVGSQLSKSENTKPFHELLIEIAEPLIAKGLRFSFIGHSSGGAVATLMADLFERKYPKKVKRVVTFGQPAVGNKHFHKHYKLHLRTYRVCCDLDMVTFMPPFPFYFYHVGRMLWLHDDKIYENMPTHRRLLISLKSWIMRPITQHHMRKYIRNKTLFDRH